MTERRRQLDRVEDAFGRAHYGHDVALPTKTLVCRTCTEAKGMDEDRLQALASELESLSPEDRLRVAGITQDRLAEALYESVPERLHGGADGFGHAERHPASPGQRQYRMTHDDAWVRAKAEREVYVGGLRQAAADAADALHEQLGLSSDTRVVMGVEPTAPHLCPLCGTMHVPKPWPDDAGPPPWAEVSQRSNVSSAVSVDRENG